MITVTIEEKELIESTINKCHTCYVGLVDKDGLPYVFPMNFGYENEVIYLHSGNDGGNVAALKENPNVCITFCSDQKLAFQHEEVACSYRMKGTSVICRGKVVFEEDFDEKVKALDIMMKQYTPRQFTYSDPAVNNVRIWKIEIDTVSAKQFGAPHPKSRNYKDSETF